MATVGFIGLGHMGKPMALNLLKQHQVKVYDVVPVANHALAEAGAISAASLADVCHDVDVIITMLPAGQHVEEVYTCEDGVFKHAKANTLLIDSSTIDVGTCRRLAQLSAVKGLRMLDAPVSGGVIGAQAATLTFMVGGEENAFVAAKPILQCMGKTIIHAGAAGNGQVAKLCNNMILGVSMIAVSEAFNLAQQLGVDAQTFFNISSNATGQCWAMTSYCPVPGPVPKSPANNHYQAGFTADMMLKDLRLSQVASQNAGVATPLGAEATALYSLFARQGKGHLDFSAIIKMLAGES